jgi:hypothetical protein
MKFDSTFYDLTQDAYSAAIQMVLTHMPHSPDPADQPSILSQLRRGRAESPSWYLVQAVEFDPEPLTCENIRVRDTYACERVVAALLELMASEDWLDRDDHGRFFLTETGRLTFQRRREKLLAAIEQTSLLSEVKLARVAQLVQCIIDASLASATPPGVWCLIHSRNRAPKDDTSLLTQLIQFFDDINAFRDDCHMAAWQQLNVEGYVWEAFSLVQRGEAHTADVVFAQLMHRGYSRIEYQVALSIAARRGWIEEESDTPGSYRITRGGQVLWQQVEEMTDQYFYEPWSCLADGEAAELCALLTEIKKTAE